MKCPYCGGETVQRKPMEHNRTKRNQPPSVRDIHVPRKDRFCVGCKRVMVTR